MSVAPSFFLYALTQNLDAKISWWSTNCTALVCLPARKKAPKIIIHVRARCTNKSTGQWHLTMTHFIKNSEYEIIEQRANGNWVVLNVDTGRISEISDYYLRSIHQDDYEKKGKELAAWIESGCRM